MVEEETAPPVRASAVALLAFLAFTATLLVFLRVDPLGHPLIDDSGIILRYLDLARQGHFFTYNVEDGPVFGISGFLHGALASLLAWLGARSELALVVSNLFGSFLFFFALGALFLRLAASVWVAVASTLFILFSSQYITHTFFMGLEVPLHLGIMMTSVACFFWRRDRLCCLGSALSIISKLDAAAFIVGLIACLVVRSWVEKDLRPTLTRIAVYFGAPLLVWVAFATLLFGSPIPQSLLAKLILHGGSDLQAHFPFIEPLISTAPGRWSLGLALASAALAVGLAAVTGTWITSSVFFAVAAVGTLGLYGIYNPREQMAWYYALPELLILLAVATTPVDFARHWGRGGWFRLGLVVATSIAAAVLVLRFDMPGRAARDLIRHNEIVEGEREAVGRLADSLAPRPAILWTGHGHIARAFQGYVVDYSGLNFAPALALGREIAAGSEELDRLFDALGWSNEPGIYGKTSIALIERHRPTVLVLHGLLTPAIQARYSLRLAGSFYNNSSPFTFGAWRVFVADPSRASIAESVRSAAIDAAHREGEAVFSSPSGRSIEMELPANTAVLAFGTRRRTDPYELVARRAGVEVGRCFVQEGDAERCFGLCTQACRITLPGSDTPTIALELRSTAGPVEVFEPVHIARSEANAALADSTGPELRDASGAFGRSLWLEHVEVVRAGNGWTRLILHWRRGGSLPESPLNLGVHFLGTDGGIRFQRDFGSWPPADALVWQNEILVETGQWRGIGSIGVAIEGGGRLLDVESGQTDWDGRRLIISRRDGSASLDRR